MLKLKNITKDYVSKAQPTVHALKGISLCFRRNEFVAILGQSGCGKTTLLNIIGGLDRYTDGDLIIEGKTTKEYTSRDWDTYRNHSIGFVFQSYNLIGHINVLANVELALTISGMSKSERKKKAMAALKQVGLKGMEKKHPNQLSGGQMQRVAIARALVNDPEVLLADEPTGALDSETSIQVMDILKSISKDRLVIMVTHNPDLALQYANRIVKMSDGKIIDDSNPYKGETKSERNKACTNRERKYGKKRSSMSFLTSIGLSFNNLLTKKGRAILTAFAGSIGITGIALILSVSNGTNIYIGKIQEDALTSYPMSVSQTSVDTTSLISALIGEATAPTGEKFPTTEEVTEDVALSSMVTRLLNASNRSDISNFAEFIRDDNNLKEYESALTSISFQYDVGFKTYTNFSELGDNQISNTYPVSLTGDYSKAVEKCSPLIKSSVLNIFNSLASSLESYFVEDYFPTFSQLVPNIDSKRTEDYAKIIDDQYELLKGRMPKEKNEVVVVVDEYNRISDYVLYALGLKNPKNVIVNMVKSIGASYGISDEEINKIQDYPENELFVDGKGNFSTNFDDILKLKYYLPVSYQYCVGPYKNETTSNYYYKIRSNASMVDYISSSYADENLAIKNDGEYVMNLDVVGIVRVKDGVTTQCISGGIGYLPSLITDYVIQKSSNVTETGEFIYPASGMYKAPSKLDDPSIEKNVCAAHIKQEDSENRYDVFTGEKYKVFEAQTITDSELFLEENTIRKFLTTFIEEEEIKKIEERPIIGQYVTEMLGNNVLWSSIGYQVNNDTMTLKSQTGKSFTCSVPKLISLVDIIDAYPESFGPFHDFVRAYVAENFGDLKWQVGIFKDNDDPVGFVIYDLGIVVLKDDEQMKSDFTNKVGTLSGYLTYGVDVLTQNKNANTINRVLKYLNICDLNNPKSIYFYPNSFAAKDKIYEMVNKFNVEMEAEVRSDYAKYNGGVEPTTDAEKDMIVQKYQVSLNDTVGTLLSSVSTIVNSVTYVLIAFVAISLIVSSIMIAIITYVSVLERTKEIGILRSIGARKRDVANVFNAETLIIGTASGLIGIALASLIDIPIKYIIQKFALVTIEVSLPLYGILLLPVIAILLTVISGFVPSISASKKDPVIALRTE